MWSSQSGPEGPRGDVRARASGLSCPQALCRDRKCPGGGSRALEVLFLPGRHSVAQGPPIQEDPGDSGPHQQQPPERPCQALCSPGLQPAATAAAPRWHPPSPRPWQPRSPWCLQQQRYWREVPGRPGLPPPLGASLAGSAEGGSLVLSASPHSCSSSPSGHCSWKSHSCSGGTHRSPQDRDPGSQVSQGCKLDSWGWRAWTQGPAGSACRADLSVGKSRVRWGWGHCASPGRPGEGLGQVTWSCSAVVRQDEVVQTHHASWTRLPSQEDLKAGVLRDTRGPSVLPGLCSQTPTPDSHATCAT